MAEKKYHQGHDIKSILINIATAICFILPIAIYLNRESMQTYFMVAGGSLFLAMLAPPIGLYRPHPYSDWERNKPWPKTE
mmetsp:Transcript_19742/g.24358  ORF Transcript_19742/g.24358 Transcript_19742/m.24358 type:complete len:80 (-) Transcript_19742:329-568(-)